MKKQLETNICPLLAHEPCRRREDIKLSTEHCVNGSYEGCLTYQISVKSTRGEMSYPMSRIGFKH